jgi:hypothetical protein
MNALALNPESAIVSVDADLVRAALPFAGKNDVRYYLNGVCIRPADDGGALIIATNGTVMVCIRDEAGRADKPRIVPLQDRDARHMKRGHKLCMGEDQRAWVHDTGMRVQWICPDLEIDGKYPDAFGLLAPLDEYAEGLVGVYNPKLLDLIRKGARGRYGAVRFFHRRDAGSNSAALFSFGPTGFGILMPMRDEAGTTDLAAAIPREFHKAAA